MVIPTANVSFATASWLPKMEKKGEMINRRDKQSFSYEKVQLPNTIRPSPKSTTIRNTIGSI